MFHRKDVNLFTRSEAGCGDIITIVDIVVRLESDEGMAVELIKGIANSAVF